MMKQTDQNSPQRTSAHSRRKTTRREFLTTSTAIVASTFAAPAILRARGVSEKLNIAVIGSGGRGGANLDAVAGTENIVTLCDVNQSNLDR